MGLHQKKYLIDPVKLKSVIKESELRVWWIAEQMKVDRGTVSRWLSGRVKKIQEVNLESLISILEVDRDSIIIPEEPIVGSSKKDRQSAAELIVERDLITLLAATEDFLLAEKILKALIHPDLPKNLLSQLYTRLSSSLWKQQKYSEAKKCVQRSIEIAIEVKSKTDEYKARINYSLLELLSGDVSNALVQLKKVIESSDNEIETFHARSYLCNALCYYGRIEESAQLLQSQLESPILQRFEQIRRNNILATMWGFHCDVLIELNHLSEAQKANSISRQHLIKTPLLAVKINADLREAEIEARKSGSKKSITTYETAIREAEDKDITPSIFYLYGARVYRLAADYDKASSLITKALLLKNDPPVRGSFWIEKRNLCLLQGHKEEALMAQKKAERIYRTYGMEARLDKLRLSDFENTNLF